MKKTKKDVVKDTDFANTIFRIRTERDLTQKKLADKLNISDKTISKWEKGDSVPDLINIQNICNELEVSPSSIVNSKRTFKDRINFIKRKIGTFFNYCLNNIFLIFFSVAFILLLVYFLNNYNTVKVYSIKYVSDNISITNGYFFKTKVVNILDINDITLNKLEYEPVEIKLELYTYYNGDKYMIYEANDLKNIYIEESKNYSDILTSDAINSMKNNLYLDIITKDKDGKTYTYGSTLTLTDKFSNNKLSYKNYLKNQDYDNSYLTYINEATSYENTKPDIHKVADIADKSVSSENKLSNLGYEYNETSKKYTKIDSEGGTIEYMPTISQLKYVKENDNLVYNLTYYIDSNRIEFNIFNTNNATFIMCSKYLVDKNKNKCSIGDCEKYFNEIDYILSVYQAINNTP